MVFKEIDISEFEKLEDVERKRGIVNWEEVMKSLSGKVFMFSDIKELVKKKYKKVLRYSEWSDVFDRFSVRDDFVCISKLRMVGNRVRRLFYVKYIGSESEGEESE